MAEFPHGFPADCERHALEVRTDLGIKAEDRLDLQALADNLAIPVYSLSDLEEHCSDSVRQLRDRDRSGFSALTLFNGTKRMIIYNPAHAPGRRASSIAHEFGHVLLEHPAAPVRDADGQRHWSGKHEREADLMAATLLVPRPGIIPVMYRVDGDVGAAAEHFGVSVQLMTWRYKKTGVERQMQRAAANRSSG